MPPPSDRSLSLLSQNGSQGNEVEWCVPSRGVPPSASRAGSPVAEISHVASQLFDQTNNGIVIVATVALAGVVERDLQRNASGSPVVAVSR